MAWTKVPKEHEELMDRILENVQDVVRRKMFGCPAYFVGTNMFAGAHQNDIILRLSDDDQDAMFDGKHITLFTPMQGRPMKSYVVVPPEILKSESELLKWALKARDYAATLPAKEKKPRKRV
jgi:TfoX/Sxy family transcriptional regulator of competence genes